MMLSIFSCVYWPSLCLLWRNICLGLLSERFKCCRNLAGRSASKSLLSPGYFADLFTDVKDARDGKGSIRHVTENSVMSPFPRAMGVPLSFVA